MISKTEWVNCIIKKELATLTKDIYIVFKYMPVQ